MRLSILSCKHLLIPSGIFHFLFDINECFLWVSSMSLLASVPQNVI